MASFDPHHSLYEEEQATKYPHFIHVETESEKICDLPRSCGGKHGLDRVRKPEFWSLFGQQGPNHHISGLFGLCVNGVG